VATPFEVLEIAGREVRITNPGKVFFPARGITKLDLARYYVDVMPGALTGCRDRPTTMYRWPNGVDAPDDAFYQKRVPPHRPEWIQTTTIDFPSGRSAEMPVVADGAHILWMVNLGCLDVNPWPVRRADVDHPDELRLDLDPTPEIPFDDVRAVALELNEVLGEHGLTGWAKSSGKRGIHVLVRVEPRWPFTEIRRAALALARAVERRTPKATTAWWKEERVGVFIDYNQNARDRTVASAYSVRPTPDARVSCPITWDEIEDFDPAELRLETVPERFARLGDPHAGIDEHPGSLEAALELARRDESEGLGDAPWPPHFPKAPGEPVRAQPSKRRRDA
jgi:bifunctional non-homologous end joining protein LigD